MRLLKGSGATLQGLPPGAVFIIPINFQCTLHGTVEDHLPDGRAEEGEGRRRRRELHAGIPPGRYLGLRPGDRRLWRPPRPPRTTPPIPDRFGERPEPALSDKFWQPGEAVAYACAKATGEQADRARPHPGQSRRGRHGDTTGMLHALVAEGAEGAAFANLCDPRSAEAAHQAGVGAGSPSHRRLGRRRRRQSLHGTLPGGGAGDGNVPRDRADLWRRPHEAWPDGVLKKGGVRVALTTRKEQGADQAMLRQSGSSRRNKRSWR